MSDRLGADTRSAPEADNARVVSSGIGSSELTAPPLGTAAVRSGLVTPDERWLAAAWPFVRDNLPAPPARVLEIGCGPLGGFVPSLRADGYRATGIDPEAPEAADYSRVDFERYDVRDPVDAVVACTSMHHVEDLGDVLDKVRSAMAPAGVLVIVEWAWERFDEATARWCFDRLAPSGAEPGAEHEHDHDHGWMHERRAEWQSSGKSWDVCCREWAEREVMHTGQEILHELDTRFDRRLLEFGPFYFSELDGVTEAEEQAAIDAGLIQAGRIQYVGGLR
ncbi:MAG: methyltransferase domain-containing protein [Nocardioides sp.]|nr:methyltransferase domain-containing protein [Nocardioides sp.]